jgi:hypothetical protein
MFSIFFIIQEQTEIKFSNYFDEFVIKVIPVKTCALDKASPLAIEV